MNFKGDNKMKTYKEMRELREKRKGWEIVRLPNGEYVWIVR